MPVIKTPCPKCDASMRFTVDGEGDHDVTCLKCGYDFVATLEADEPPTKSKKSKPGTGTKERLKAEGAKSGRATKRARRDDDDEDDDDDAPRKKKKKAGGDSGQQKIIIAGAVAGVLLLGGLGALIFALTGSSKPTKNDSTAEVKPQPTNGPIPSTPNPGPNADPPKPGPGPNTPSNPNANPPKKANPQEPQLPPLPPPPKIRPSGGKLTTTTPVVKAPPVPPLAPDEDPFVRASTFKPDGPLPAPPALPKGTQRPLLTLDSGGHTGFVSKVFFNTKNDQIITVGEDKAVRFWDPTTNETVKTVRFPAGPGHEGSLQAAAMSRSGKRLAVAGEPLAKVQAGQVPIYIISPDTGALIKRLDVGSAAVTGLSFSNDGNWLGVGCENGTIQMVNVSTGASYPAPPISKASVMEVKYNPNPKAKLLATLGADHFVQIWNFAATAQHKDFPISGATPSTLAWSNDGQTLAVATTTGGILLGSANGQFQKSLPPVTHNGKPLHIHQMQFMPNDREIAIAGASGANGWTGIVSADSGTTRTGVTAHSNVVFALDVSAEGDRIVSSGGNQHETLVWKSDDGKIEHRLAGTGNGIWAIAWAKDGKSLAWGASNKKEEGVLALEGTFRLDEFGVGNPPDPSKYTQTVESDDAGVKLRTGSSGFMVQTAGRDPALVALPDREPIYSATILPKGNAVLVGGVRNLYMVNPATRAVMRSFVGHSGNVLCVTPSPDSRYFATGSSDQTIRIWQRDREEPILSIFVAGREWIAWTPAGYYACSGQGERLVAWQIQAAGAKVPQVHPAERFRSSMYQPALLKYLIPAGNLPVAMAMAQKFDKALVQTTSVADVLPPEVTLDGFTETELKVDKDSFTVKARATSAKHPITAMRLLVNGRPFKGAAGVKRFENADPSTPAEATWEIPLVPGTQTVAVIADSPVSKGMSKIGVVIRPGEIPKPNLYVLAMGVSDYPGSLKLRYCATDAEMLAAAFKDKSKNVFSKIEVKLLTDKSATKQGIRDGLDWMKSKMTPQDVGIVSFSGHGMRDLFNRFYLVPFDVKQDDFEGTSCLPGDEFKARLDNMPGRLVAILDACHSGSVAEKDRAPAQADTLVRDLTAEDSGVIVMCASLGREYAIESPISKAGFFTLGLVEGLSGYGDIDEDGVVYIHELDTYATARVRQLSGGTQNPTLGRPSAVRPFAIAKPDNPLRAQDPKPAPAPSKPPAPSTPPVSTNPTAPGTATGPTTPGAPNKPPAPLKPPISDK